MTLAPGQRINFSNGANAVFITKENLTLKGAAPVGFDETIGAFGGAIGGLRSDIYAQRATLTLAELPGMISSWQNNLFPDSNLSGIVGQAGSRERPLANNGDDDNKWLATHAAAPSAANGLGLQNLYFGDADFQYKNDKYVNPLIGNDNLAHNFTSIGDVAGNVFKAINVTLASGDDTDYLAGGGLVGVRSTGESGTGIAEMGKVSGNIFDAVTIVATDGSGSLAFDPGHNNDSAYLEGGGLIGVNGASSPGEVNGHAFLKELSNNYFTGIKILSNDVLLGGGLVGVNNNSKHAASDAVYAMIGTPSDSSDFTQGATGGVLGNVFGNGESADITVQTGYSIRGGGVIGMNGLSNAAVDLVNLQDNAFAGISVETGTYIKGGGIVGLQTNDGGIAGGDLDLGLGEDPSAAPAILGSASGNIFFNQTVSAGSFIEGGGIIGLRSNMGRTELGTLENNFFKEITVHSDAIDNAETGPISGGGVVGLSAATQAEMGHDGGAIQNNTFENIHVVAGEALDSTAAASNFLNGGGIIGVHTRNASDEAINWATMENVHGNRFADSDVTAISINGGGILGVNAGGAPEEADFRAGLAALGNVTGNIFERLKIDTVVDDGNGNGHLEGGGVIGVWNKDSTIGSLADNEKYGVSAIDGINDNIFRNIEVNAGSYLQGGGIIGIRGSALEQMGSLRRNTFTSNTIYARDYIDGGGVIGVTSRDGSDPYAGIKLIGESVFTENNVSAGGDVFGGLVYSYGLTNVDGGGMTISDSSFFDNEFSSTTGIVYGAVTVDAGAAPMNGNENTLTLTATPGNSTEFRKNTIADQIEQVFSANGWESPRLSSSRTNSLYFGTIPNPAPSLGDPADEAEWSPELVVAPQAGGIVALYDPIWVNQADPAGSDDGDDHSFAMNVNGEGDFIWGGANVFTLDTAASGGDAGTSGTVTLEQGVTTLLDGRSGTTFVNGSRIAGDHVATMILDAPNFKFELADGARLNVEGHNRFDLSGTVGTAFADSNPDPRGPTVADLKGTLHFNLHNTDVYREGEVPGDSGHLLPDDDVRLTAGYAPLLTIDVPAVGEKQIDLSGSVVSLSDFKDSTRTLMPGDRFYLIEARNGAEDVAADQTFAAFTDGDPVNGADTVRHGNLTTYTFIIDKNYENLGIEEDTRFLVARLRRVDPGAGAPPVSTARVPGITLLQRSNDWLTGIPFYNFPSPAESCDPCDPCDPCAARNQRRPASAGVTEDWVWTSFAEVKGSWFRANAHESGYADVRGTLAFAGVAAQRRMHDGSIHFGAFFDVGSSNYTTSNHVVENNAPRSIRGDGDLENAGGGVAFRRNWDNGLRLDLMARAGVNRNRFTSNDLTDVVTHAPTSFKLRSAYVGATIGLDYGWKFGRSGFNVYGRYSWLMEEGAETRLSSDEVVDFAAIHSHRGVVGGRWTWDWNPRVSSYVGAAYEHEFDGKVRLTDRTTRHNIAYDGVNLSGGTGIGELGVTYRHNERFDVTAGVEGYVGKREGVGALLSAVWRW